MSTLKTVKLTSVLNNLALETDGTWVDFPEWGDVAFKVSPFSNPAFVTARDLTGQRLARRFKAGPIPDDEARATSARLYVDHILHDWRGFDEAFEPEKAYQLLASLEGRRLATAIEWCAMQAARADLEYVETEVKNSNASSGDRPKGQMIRSAG